ncbi:hypothetical protein NDU88_005835 [Pleurodeles waltl]|uniref:Uncharacterized protein n=1 Tax=Pleurodeles waltl TaxID=8319 RepID=A0AAV7MAI1_PLEWA|nr:hypothetical protein NDU88_005835 [Pleurodeles waltl]
MGFGAIRKPQVLKTVPRKRRESCSISRHPIFSAAPSGACPRGLGPAESRQEAAMRLQRSVLRACGIRGFCGGCGGAVTDKGSPEWSWQISQETWPPSWIPIISF